LPIQHLKFTDQFNVPGWSISCEMLFYLLAPIIIWRLLQVKNLRHLILLMAVIWPASLLIIGKPSNEFMWPTRFAPLRVPEFTIGIVAAICYIRCKTLFKKSWVFIASGLILIVVAFVYNNRFPIFLQFGPLAAPGAALLIVGLAIDQGVAARLFSNRWIVLLGMSSFAFYLIHDPMIRICKAVFQHYQLTIAGPWISAAFGVALFILTQFFSIALFKMVEIPIQKYLRKLVQKNTRNKLPGASSSNFMAQARSTKERSSV
jgi:peptidoglycan/LPS O-acetylase OafA/YrhL